MIARILLMGVTLNSLAGQKHVCLSITAQVSCVERYSRRNALCMARRGQMHPSSVHRIPFLRLRPVESVLSLASVLRSSELLSTKPSQPMDLDVLPADQFVSLSLAPHGDGVGVCDHCGGMP